MSSFSEPTEFPCAVRSSGGEGLCAGGTWINPALLCAPTVDLSFEATVGNKQEMPGLHHGDEASLPSHSHASAEAFLAYVQWGPQPNLPRRPSFLTHVVSASRFPMIRVQE